MQTGIVPASLPVPERPGESPRRLRRFIRDSLIASCDLSVAAIAGVHRPMALASAGALQMSLLTRWIDLAPWRVQGSGFSFDLLEQSAWVRSIQDPDEWGQMTGVDREGRYEAAFLAAFVRQAQRARVIVDAGAARGLYSLVAAHLPGPEEIHAFEPDHARRFALRLNLLRAPEGKRFFIRRSFLGAAGSGNLTLDRYCQRAGIVPDLIKMDIEGAEIDVLEGARQVCLLHGPTLLIEFHQRRLRRQGRDPRRLLALLAECGYQVTFNGRRGALETGERAPDLEWRNEPPNPDLTAILATSPARAHG